ncbi:hypothetical protein C900_05874 [Fulvivirga imtechensis AK7]|uniref:Uncharacterized protein n=1 Tax=Fulvivirga imtechensis AK7 TaxID=1237149 RepID=L8JN20_9BACT|nr:hypothetical protein C900_05874 [Fulvivirga imtechensis AK7]
MDATFSVIGVVPGYGTLIGGIYFGADLITLGITGQGISEHIDNYMWMSSPIGIGYVPFTERPRK